MSLRLVGESCVLRDVVPDDVDTFRYWLGPQHTWQDTNGPYFGRFDAVSVERSVGVMAQLATGEDLPEPRRRIVIADPDEDRLIGRVEWHWECEETDWRRLGIALYDPRYRGRGTGREALTLWTDYLFAHTDALRLDLSTYSGNVGMCRAAEAAGYRLEARMRKARRWSGGVHDAMVFGVLREEWTPR